MNTRTQQILLHITGWMVFLSLPLLFSPESLSLHAYLANPPTQRDLIAYIMIAAIFYLNFYWLIPRLYFHKKYFTFFLVGGLSFIPIVFLPNYIVSPTGDSVHTFLRPFGTLPPSSGDGPPGQPPPIPPSNTPEARHPRSSFGTQPSDLPDSRLTGLSLGAPPPNGPDSHHTGPFPGMPPSIRAAPSSHIPASPFGHAHWRDIGQFLFLFLGMFCLALLLKIRDRWKQTEKDRLRAELSYLKAQINPHFLFNSLNNIYSLAIERSDQTPEAIIQLSGMMRYILNETGKEWVPLEKEITYIRNYIALQQTRFGTSVPLDFQINTTSPDRPGKTPADPRQVSLSDTQPNLPRPFENPKIAPLILICFIENAFQHGVNAEENSAICIRIDISKEELHLYVANNKVTVRQQVDTHNGLGIGNTRERLQLLYPGDHLLDIRNNAHDFQVSLTLKLK